MAERVTTVRLEERTLNEIDSFAKVGFVDRTTVLRQALLKGLNELKLTYALQKYVAGDMSAWKAACLAGMSLWDFIEVLNEKDIGFKTDENEIKKQLQGL